MTDKELYKKALDTWGIRSQIDQAQEELNELAVALNHIKRGRSGAHDELMSEIADVEIVLEQVKIMFPDLEAIERFKERKLTRLAGMLGEAYEAGE